LGTRVRIDIRKGIAKITRFSFSSFFTWPVLRIKQRGSEQKPVGLTFINAVTSFGHEMVEDDLGEAYRRAGKVVSILTLIKFCCIKGKEECHRGCLRWSFLLHPEEEAKKKTNSKYNYGKGVLRGEGVENELNGNEH
jgi:hypothetical protein